VRQNVKRNYIKHQSFFLGHKEEHSWSQRRTFLVTKKNFPGHKEEEVEKSIVQLLGTKFKLKK